MAGRMTQTKRDNMHREAQEQAFEAGLNMIQVFGLFEAVKFLRSTYAHLDREYNGRLELGRSGWKRV